MKTEDRCCRHRVVCGIPPFHKDPREFFRMQVACKVHSEIMEDRARLSSRETGALQVYVGTERHHVK